MAEPLEQVIIPLKKIFSYLAALGLRCGTRAQ